MGLGSPIARSIVEVHNGRIRADNKSALGGARFIFELPVNPPPSDEVHSAAMASVIDSSRPLVHQAGSGDASIYVPTSAWWT